MISHDLLPHASPTTPSPLSFSRFLHPIPSSSASHLHHHDLSDFSSLLASFLFGPMDVDSIALGRLLHGRILRAGSEALGQTERLVVQMYCKFGCVGDASVLFNAMSSRSHQSTWNKMIGMCIELGHSVDARTYFSQMLTEGHLPNRVTFSTLLSACTRGSYLAEGQRLHAQIKSGELDSDLVIGTPLIVMYGKCSSLNDVQAVFNSLILRDVTSWTALINAYVRFGKNSLALEAFNAMQREKIMPSRVTFISILSACIGKTDLNIGKEIHRCIKRSGFDSDVVLSNALISMYGRCGSLDDASTVFDLMSERNVISWNAVIGAHAHNGQGEEALRLMDRMQHCALPDTVTFVSVLDACADCLALMYGKRVHCNIADGKLRSSITLANALVNMYGKCGSCEDAARVFDDMDEQNETSWNVLITLFANRGQILEEVCLFHHMQQKGLMPNKITFVSNFSACADQQSIMLGKQLHSLAVACGIELDVVVGTSLVNMYGKSHSLIHALEIFNKMPEHNMICYTTMISAFSHNGDTDSAFVLFNSVNHKCDVVLWNSMISSFAQNGQGKRALALFEQMLLEGIMPDRVTFISCVDAAGVAAVLGVGKQIHSRILGSAVKRDGIIQNAIVNMYGKCGSLEIAWGLFMQLPKRDVFSWSSIIAAYAQIGHGRDALHIFDQMRQEGVKPDKVTFINVLSACNHAGLVHEGCHYFVSMNDDYSIAPMVDHYNCIIDLLGKSGRLEEAEEVIRNMQVQASVVSWFTMLSACRNKNDVLRGERAADSVFKLDPDNAIPYIMLANIYNATEHPECIMNGPKIG